jgi:hypothetical protein
VDDSPAPESYPVPPEVPGAGAPAADGAAPRRRRWWAIAADPVLPGISTRRAYGEVLFVYLVFFGVGIIAAGLLLGGRGHDLPTGGSWGVYSANIVDQLAQIGLAVAVVLLLAARRGVSAGALGVRVPREADGRVATSRAIRMCAWCFLAIIVGGIINSALQTGHLPTSNTNAPELIFGVADALQAGIIEELVVLAFLVVTLRQANRPWWEVVTVALVLRGAYHIYYGPGVVGIIVWAALYLWIYLRFRDVVPLMVCHALWDAVGFLSQAASAVAGFGMLCIILLWITAVVLWLVDRSNGGSVAVAGPGYGYAYGPPHGGYPGAAWPPSGPGPGPAANGTAGPGSGWAPGPPGQTAPAGTPPAVATSAPAVPAPAAAAPPPPGAGWFPDPSGANRWRWWDGQRWTEHISTH